jgi:serine/threonine protein kinase
MSLPTTDEPPRPPERPGEADPEHIGRYRILGRLGAGGMGTVYKAHDPQLDRIVALKLPHLGGPPQTLDQRAQRFQREARAAARVWHSHVCPIFDVGEHEGQPFVVMKHVEGGSLEDRLAGRGRFEDVGEAVALMRQILDGLAAVHAEGIVHRDLKPANVLLDTSGAAVLTDFGLARPEDDAERLTSDGVILGTPHYMAPEQAAGQSDRIGPRTDVYSAGVVLYRMITGRLPFEGPPLVALARIVHDEIPPPSRWRPGMDPALEAVVLKALAKDPTDRYQGAASFAHALKGRLGDATGETAARNTNPSPSATGPLPVALPTRRRKLALWKRFALAAIALFGLGALGICYLVLSSVQERSQPGNSDKERNHDQEHLVVGVCVTFPTFVAVLAGLYCSCVALYMRFVVATERALLRWSATPSADYVAKLLWDGVPVDCTDGSGETPLMKASQAGQLSVVKVLVAQGANVQKRNPFGQTALAMAAAAGYADIVDLLKRAGAIE